MGRPWLKPAASCWISTGARWGLNLPHGYISGAAGWVVPGHLSVLTLALRGSRSIWLGLSLEFWVLWGNLLPALGVASPSGGAWAAAMLPTALGVTGIENIPSGQGPTGLSGALFEALIHAVSGLSSTISAEFGFLLAVSCFLEPLLIISHPPPLKLGDDVIAALAFALAICQTPEVKVLSQEKDLARKVGTTGIKGESL